MSKQKLIRKNSTTIPSTPSGDTSYDSNDKKTSINDQSVIMIAMKILADV